MSVAEPIIASLYQGNQVVELDLVPLWFDRWTASSGDPMNPKWAPLVQAACGLLVSDELPAEIKLRNAAGPDNMVLEMHFPSGRGAFLRVLKATEGSPDAEWIKGRFNSEVALLGWFEHVAPKLPVPRLLAEAREDGLAVTTLMPGLDAMHSYPLLDGTAKKRALVSWARVAVQIFNLPVPQRLGSPYAAEGPNLSINKYFGVTSTFDVDESEDLLAFFTRKAEARRNRSSTTINANDAEAHSFISNCLDRLLEGIRPIIAEMMQESLMRRLVLVHSDLRPDNILLDPTSGELVGIIDWEYSACMPAIMATEYPPWASEPIIEEPEFENPKSRFNHYQLESASEIKQIRKLYEKTVKELDENYWQCLVRGKKLRDAYQWLDLNDYESDVDGTGMERWVERCLFGSGAHARYD